MSSLKMKVGNWNFRWLTVPKGREGVAQVEVNGGQVIEVRWRKDSQGIWLSLPGKFTGFDIDAHRDDEDQIRYRLIQRICHLNQNQSECVDLLVSQGEGSLLTGNKKTLNKTIRIRAQMPGKMIRILVRPGDTVRKDQSLAVMEAMKMENEIRAPADGQVSQVKVGEGQAVETGADLILISPEGSNS